MRVELRIVVALALAAAAWLAFVPAGHPTTGESCGAPLTAPARVEDLDVDEPPECVAVNNLRVQQALATAVGAGAIVAGNAFVRFLLRARDAREAALVAAARRTT